MSKKIIFCFFIFGFIFIFLFFNSSPSNHKKKIDKKIYLIQKRKSGEINKIFKQLKKDNFIKSAFFIKFLARLTGYDKKIFHGAHQISFGKTSFDILVSLTKKNASILVTFPEGFDNYQIAEELTKKKIIQNSKEFLAFCRSEQAINIVKKYIPSIQNLLSVEGFLYPDTYALPYQMDYLSLVEIFVANFYQKNKEFGFLHNSKFYYWMKIASLIEKETSLDEERKIISSVIYNRLQKKMRLAIDSSIIYALKKKNLYHKNLKNGKINIRRKHFTLKSKYNTYYIKGLPIEPICNPTMSSILAAIFPDKTDYIFFVAKKDGKGSHDFSITYKEHERKIRKYILKR